MKNPKPLVSVIMNAYNGELFIKESIQSVIDQTYDNWEIILWDNCSEDRTAEVVKSFNEIRIKYLLSATSTPLGEARNLAIKESQGEYLAFLDCDDLWLPSKLEKQILLFEDSEVGLVISDTIFFNQKGNEKQIYKTKKPPIGYVFKALLSEYFISLETVIVRRQALDSLDHLFDNRFQVIEEFDLFLRLSLSWKLDFVDEVLARWRVHESSWTWTKAELFPNEKRMMIQKYASSIKGFKNDYKKEIKLLERSCSLEEGLLLWEKGNSQGMREKIRPYLGYKPKWILLYISTFFPRRFYLFLQKVRGNVSPD